jgi:hypothetical protein
MPRRIICALSASRGCVGERACHFLLDALHSAVADAKLTGNLENALPGPQLSPDAFFHGCADSPAIRRRGPTSQGPGFPQLRS